MTNSPAPKNLRIGVDLMGGDDSPSSLFQGLVTASQELPPDVSLVAFATEALSEQMRHLHAHCLLSFPLAQISLVFAKESISMEDNPLVALRRKRHSTLHLAFEMLRQRELDALISVANTGALVAGAALFLPPLPNMARPALLASLPTELKPVVLLDVGGNLATKPEHLLQFAQMGAAYYAASFDNSAHSSLQIGLLNIGKETGKGGEQRMATFSLLEQHLTLPLKFAGNVEPQDVFTGKVDVVVTDGFSGNIFLKAAEGIAACIFRNISQKLSSSEMLEFKELQERFNSEYTPGAVLCGIDRLVIKCHGDSTSKALYQAIRQAHRALKDLLLTQIKHSLSQINSLT